MNKDNKDTLKLYISRACRLLALAGMIVCIYCLLDYALSDDTKVQARISFHEYYAEEHIDNLFVGTSHTANGINTTKLSELTGEECYNIGTSGQLLLGTYYIAKEAVERGNVDKIFCEISVDSLFWKETDETPTFIISDYMKSKKTRLELITSALDSSSYINAFLKVRRNVDNLKSPSDIMSVIKAKRSDDYKNYVGSEVDLGKGQWKAKKDYPLWFYGDNLAIKLNAWSLDFYPLDELKEYNWETYENILDLGSESDTELIMYIMPMQKCYLKYFDEYGGYGEIVHDIKALAKEHNITLIDLNTVKEEYLDLDVSEYKDMEHITSKGSDKVAKFFAKYIEDPNKDYFYNTWDVNYKEEGKIFATAYNSYFITENGEYGRVDDAVGTITDMKIDISAAAYGKVPVDIKVTRIENVEGDPRGGDAKWADVEEINAKKLDEYTALINVPYNNLETFYRISFYAPGEDELLFETITRFDMK